METVNPNPSNDFFLQLKSKIQWLFFQLKDSWISSLFLVSVLIAFQSSILPSITNNFFQIDFLTPVLLSYAIQFSFSRILVITVFASLLVETHSSAPAGSELVPQLMMVIWMYAIRDWFSWRQIAPWICVFVLGLLWNQCFEWMLMYVVLDSFGVHWMHLIQLILHIVFGAGIVSAFVYFRLPAPEDVDVGSELAR